MIACTCQEPHQRLAIEILRSQMPECCKRHVVPSLKTQPTPEAP